MGDLCGVISGLYGTTTIALLSYRVGVTKYHHRCEEAYLSISGTNFTLLLCKNIVSECRFVIFITVYSRWRDTRCTAVTANAQIYTVYTGAEGFDVRCCARRSKTDELALPSCRSEIGTQSCTGLVPARPGRAPVVPTRRAQVAVARTQWRWAAAARTWRGRAEAARASR